MEQSTLDKIRSRPRFKLITDTSPENYYNSVKKLLNSTSEFTGNVNPQGANIIVNNGSADYWSPRLTLRAEKEDGKTAIRGVFGPSSAVWTFFMFLYFIFGILWMVFTTLWFVGRQIGGGYSWALPISLVMLLLICGVYAAAQFGQKKAKPEMGQLRNFALESIKNINEILE